MSTYDSSMSRNMSSYKCDQCDFMFLKTDELREHKIAIHKMYGCIYVCNGCDYKTSRITTFWAHKLNMHGDGPLQENNMSNGNLFLNVLASQQENIIDDIRKNIISMGMRLKPSKCRSFSIRSGKAVDVSFHIGDSRIPSIHDEEQKFLGKLLFFSGKLTSLFMILSKKLQI